MPLLQRSLPLFVMAMAASVLLTGGKPTLAAPAAGYRATVLSVGDGDTLRVQAGGSSINIRLACIDAPQTAQSPWGEKSRSYLMERLQRGHEVTIQPQTTDRYGRTVAEVISDININLLMVEDGQALSTGTISAAVTRSSIWMRSSGPAAIATGYGSRRAASPAPGISGGAARPR